MNKKICKKCQKILDKTDDICDKCSDIIAGEMANTIWDSYKWYAYIGALTIFLLGLFIGVSI